MGQGSPFVGSIPNIYRTSCEVKAEENRGGETKGRRAQEALSSACGVQPEGWGGGVVYWGAGSSVFDPAIWVGGQGQVRALRALSPGIVRGVAFDFSGSVSPRRLGGGNRTDDGETNRKLTGPAPDATIRRGISRRVSK